MRAYQKQTENIISVYFCQHNFKVYRNLMTLTMSPVLSNYALRIYLKRAPSIKE